MVVVNVGIILLDGRRVILVTVGENFLLVP